MVLILLIEPHRLVPIIIIIIMEEGEPGYEATFDNFVKHCLKLINFVCVQNYN